MTKKKKYTIILSIIGILQIIFLVLVPLFSKFLVDEAEILAKTNNKDYTKLIIYIISIFSTVILAIIFKIIYNQLYSVFSLRRDKELKDWLYKNIIKTELKEIKKYSSGEIEQLFHEDIRNIIKVELDTIPNIIRQLSRLLLSTIMLIYIDWKFLIFIILCGLLGFSFAKIYSKIIKPRHKKVLEADGYANSFLVESFNQMKLIQSYDSYDRFKDKYMDLNDNAIKAKRKRNNIIYGANSGIFAFTNLIYVLALCYGAFFIAKGNITYGSLFALIQLLNNIQNPLLSMSPLFNYLSLGNISSTRISNMASMDKNLDSDIDDFDSILFDNVSFSYDNETYVIKDLNLNINKNDIVLFSGQSGIGKTTLFMLLLGFYKPTKGNIYVIWGEKKIEISSSTRNLFSYVPQENMIFKGTIYENLNILTGKNKDEIINALKLSNVYDDILKLEKGLDTILNEKGSGLSLGQIQRILIASAILRDKPIFLLDEFSSALDENNENIIINNLTKLDKTIIYISHRKKQINGEKIINLENK